MTNGENLKALPNDALGSFFCRALEQTLESTDIFCCDVCPVKDLCHKGHNGFEAWLNKECEEGTD